MQGLAWGCRVALTAPPYAWQSTATPRPRQAFVLVSCFMLSPEPQELEAASPQEGENKMRSSWKQKGKNPLGKEMYIAVS